MPHRFLRLATLLAVSCVAVPAVIAQTQLKIPRTPDEMQKVMRDSDEACTTCGIVSNVRQVAASSVSARPGAPDPRFSGSTAPSDEVQPTQLYDSRTTAKERRAARKPTEAMVWQVTVRYDNGTYAAFRQDDEPTVVQGDKVRVVEGRVEPR